MDPEVKFLADCMLGKLARWLRALGADTAYERDMEDADLVEKARAEGRLLLTRDHRLLERRRLLHGFLVEHDDPMEQVAQVAGAFGLRLDPDRMFSRCLDCNCVLQNVKAETVRDQVPAYVRATQDRFAFCPNCRRIFWSATHVEGMRRRLEEALETAS